MNKERNFIYLFIYYSDYQPIDLYCFIFVEREKIKGRSIACYHIMESDKNPRYFGLKPAPVPGPDRVGSGCRTLLYIMKIKSIHKFSSFDSFFFFFTLKFIDIDSFSSSLKYLQHIQTLNYFISHSPTNDNSKS